MNKIKDNIFICYIVILSVSAVLAHTYYYESFDPDLRIYEQLMSTHIDMDYRKEILIAHKRIISGDSRVLAPTRYRILSTYVCEAISRILNVTAFFRDKNRAFFASYAIFYFLAIFFLLISLFYWLRIWFSNEQALIGVLFVAGTITIAFRDHVYAQYSLLEVGFFTASLIAIYEKRYWILAFLIAVSTMNRETSVFIPLAFFFANLDVIRSSKIKNLIRLKPIFLSCGFFMIWAVVFFGLRYYRGWVPSVMEVGAELPLMLTRTGLFYTLKNLILFLGGFWIFAILGIKHAPGFVRRVSLVIPLYIVPVCLWAPWWEVRLLMTMYPLFIALGLSYIYQTRLNTSAS